MTLKDAIIILSMSLIPLTLIMVTTRRYRHIYGFVLMVATFLNALQLRHGFDPASFGLVIGLGILTIILMLTARPHRD